MLTTGRVNVTQGDEVIIHITLGSPSEQHGFSSLPNEREHLPALSLFFFLRVGADNPVLEFHELREALGKNFSSWLPLPTPTLFQPLPSRSFANGKYHYSCLVAPIAELINKGDKPSFRVFDHVRL